MGDYLKRLAVNFLCFTSPLLLVGSLLGIVALYKHFGIWGEMFGLIALLGVIAVLITPYRE